LSPAGSRGRRQTFVRPRPRTRCVVDDLVTRLHSSPAA
jgi:hypothetical protein